LFLGHFEKSQKVKSLLSNLISKENPHKHHKRFGGALAEDSEEEDDEEDEDFGLTVSADEQEAILTHKAEEKEPITEEPVDESIHYEDDDFIPEEDRYHSDREEDNSDDEFELKASKRVVTRDIQYNTDKTPLKESSPSQPPLLPTPPVVTATLDEQSVSSQDSDNSWNALTKVEQTVIPFTSVICMPLQLQASHCWGSSKKYIQFSNFSKLWKFVVNWIDEDGALIQRANIEFGKTHFEYCSIEHVWAVVATPIKPRSRGGDRDTPTDTSLPPMILIFRPSQASLIEGKSTCILWTPWSAIAISQRLYSKSSQKIYELKQEENKIQPCIQVQLLESKIKEFNWTESSSDAKILDEQAASQLIRKPLQTSRPRPTNQLEKSKRLIGRKSEDKK